MWQMMSPVYIRIYLVTAGLETRCDVSVCTRVLEKVQYAADKALMGLWFGQKLVGLSVNRLYKDASARRC